MIAYMIRVAAGLLTAGPLVALALVAGEQLLTTLCERLKR